jgi:hypothetical protein
MDPDILLTSQSLSTEHWLAKRLPKMSSTIIRTDHVTRSCHLVNILAVDVAKANAIWKSPMVGFGVAQSAGRYSIVREVMCPHSTDHCDTSS